MRPSSLTLFCLLAALPAWADVTATSRRWGGIEAHFAARIEPDAPVSGTLREMVFVDSTRVIRILRDESERTYFGYDLSIEPFASSKHFRIQIAPLTATAELLQGKLGGAYSRDFVDPTWTRLSLPTYPVIPEVRLGATVAIDLLVNPSTGRKIVDYITLRPANAARADAPPRDFSLADVVLDLDQPRLRVNGTVIDATAASRGRILGAAVWFYLEGHGRFAISLLPYPELGFRKAGDVSESTLIFRGGSSTYRLDCSRRIAPSPGRFLVYVLSDPTWRPDGIYANEPFLLGAADKAEWLVR